MVTQLALTEQKQTEEKKLPVSKFLRESTLQEDMSLIIMLPSVFVSKMEVELFGLLPSTAKRVVVVVVGKQCDSLYSPTCPCEPAHACGQLGVKPKA